MNKEITLKSNCIATIIPAGDEVTLAEGATFTIAQSLGNSVTLRDSNGMYRVGEDQLSALGEEIKEEVLQADQSEEMMVHSKKSKFGMLFVDVMIRRFR